MMMAVERDYERNITTFDLVTNIGFLRLAITFSIIYSRTVSYSGLNPLSTGNGTCPWAPSTPS